MAVSEGESLQVALAIRDAVWDPIWELMNPYGVSGPHITHVGVHCVRAMWARKCGREHATVNYCCLNAAMWARNVGAHCGRAMWTRIVGAQMWEGACHCGLLLPQHRNVGAQCGRALWEGACHCELLLPQHRNVGAHCGRAHATVDYCCLNTRNVGRAYGSPIWAPYGLSWSP